MQRIPERIPVSVVIMSQNGVEHRYDRYARSTSIMDTMLTEDSAVRAFTAAFGEDPISIREGRPEAYPEPDLRGGEVGGQRG